MIWLEDSLFSNYVSFYKFSCVYRNYFLNASDLKTTLCCGLVSRAVLEKWFNFLHIIYIRHLRTRLEKKLLKIDIFM